MKIIKAFTALAALSVVFSCSKQLDETSSYEPGKYVTYTASQESRNSSDAESKTTIEGTVVKWSPGDKVKLFFGSTGAEFTNQNTESSEVATFAGNLPIIIGRDEQTQGIKTVMGLYPYDADATCTNNGVITTNVSNSQTAVLNSFADGVFPTMARTIVTNYDLAFYNICGGIKFSLVINDIKKVTFKGNNGEYLAGGVKVQFDDNGKPKVIENVNPKTEISLTSASGFSTGDSDYYYLVSLPANFNQGFTIRFETDSRYAERVITSAVELKRSEWGQLSRVDNNLTWKEIDYINPFTITSNGSTSVSISKVGSPDDITLRYKKGSGEWSVYTIGTTIALTDGETLKFNAGAAGNSSFSKNTSSYYKVVATGDGTINASGNIMSLLDRSLERDNVPAYAFYRLFTDCQKLVDASNLKLPATTLDDHCYFDMFYGCSSLTSVPALPATTLSLYCYTAMFQGCTSLTTTPSLPATTLASYCYADMFRGCTGLTTTPSLPATTLASYCYLDMFRGCTSLTTVPELPATTLVSGCYEEMFYGCSKLNYVKALFTTEPSDSYTKNWLNGVSSTGKFIKSQDATWDVSGDNGVPTGWTWTVQSLFSVSGTKDVIFSPGNLQATYNSTTQNYTWGFAAHQYDYVGEAIGNTSINSQTDGAVVDLFGWSTGSTNFGINTSTDNSSYQGNFRDWGKAFGENSGWSTLSGSEWSYLLNTRTVNQGTGEGKSYKRATVKTSSGVEVYGMILYPNNYTGDVKASYDNAEWNALEHVGCVFLPAVGYRPGSNVYNVGSYGDYWSSSPTSISSEACYLFFSSNGFNPMAVTNRFSGKGVRLVQVQ